jgi:TatD DNase family protein
MKFFDAHTHLQLPAYDADREAVIARARAAGVAMINSGSQITSSRAAVELAENNADMWATVGFHPGHCNEAWHHEADEQASPEQEIFDVDALRTLSAHPKVVAIGECGLEYFGTVTEKDKQKQKEVLLAQMGLAKEVGKPLVVHCRDAFPDLIDLFTAHASLIAALPNPGLVHFFSGILEEAKRLLDMGFAFTFGGAITLPPRKGQTTNAYHEIVRALPLTSIFSETDAPWVTPITHRGQRNEPAYVVEVVQNLAELKNISVDAMAEQIRANAKRILELALD